MISASLRPLPLLRAARFLSRRLDWLSVHSRLVRVLVQDPALGIATILLAIVTLLPLGLTPILPFVDLGSAVGEAGVLFSALLGRGVIGYHYFVQLAPVPYWTCHLLLAIGNVFLGPLLSVKLVHGLAILLIPLGAMRLLAAFGRDPRLALWAFALGWDNNLYWGWISFQLGMGLSLFVIAWIYECHSWHGALRLVPWTALTALTHAHAALFTTFAGALLWVAKRPRRRNFCWHVVACSGTLLMVVTWLIGRYSAASKTGSKNSFTLDFTPLRERVSSLFHYSLDNLQDKTGQTVAALGFIVLLLGPVFLYALPQRPPSTAKRIGSAIMLFVPLSLYLGLPMEIQGPVSHWYTYPRFATYILLGLLLLPSAELRGLASFALIPGVMAVLAINGSVAEQMYAYGPKVAPYLEIIDHMRPDTRFYPVDLQDQDFDPLFREPCFSQLHGYAAAARQAFDPHVFQENSHPLQFRPDRALPTNFTRQRDFRMDEIGLYYDYVIFHGDPQGYIGEGPTSQGPSVRHIYTASKWHLYQIINPLRRE